MRGVNFAGESRRELREQIIADLGRIQERIELSAADCGLLDSGWFFKVYQTVNSLILSGKGAKEPPTAGGPERLLVRWARLLNLLTPTVAG